MVRKFRFTLAIVLVFALMMSVICIPTLADTATVNTAYLHGTGNATLATEEIILETGTTYTVSFLWKAVKGDARVQLSGSSIGNKTQVLISDGFNNMPGTNYNWQTGRVTFTFTAQNDSLVLSAMQASAEDIEFYIGDVIIYNSDINGTPVVDGEVINLEFQGENLDYEWTIPSADYITFEDMSVDDFALESDPSVISNKIIIFKYSDDWDERTFFKDITVIPGKTYTFTMYYKTLSDGNTGNISVNRTTILEGGQYGVVNGATYDPYTGLISYTFTASDEASDINMENRMGQQGKHKDYAIACPQLYESDESGVAIDGGDVIDCDETFQTWNLCGWGGNIELPPNATIEYGSKDFFVTKTHNQQPENGVYTFSQNDNWDAGAWYYDTSVTTGKIYTFSMLYKDLGGNKNQIIVDGTIIVNGGLNVLNGAVYNPYTGIVSYSFTASSDTVRIIIEGRDDSNKYGNFMIANPNIVDSDNNSVECNVDFSSWNHVVWGDSDHNLEITIVDPLLFGTKVITGDVNGDGVFNTIDLIVLKKYLAGLRSELNFASLGVEGGVNAGTVVMLRQWLLCGVKD